MQKYDLTYVCLHFSSWRPENEAVEENSLVTALAELCRQALMEKKS